LDVERGRRLIPWVLAIVLAAIVGTGIFLVWWWSPGEDLEPWRSGRPPGRWAAWNRQVEVWRAEGLRREPDHEYLPLESISIDLQLAVLVSEDINFFGHGAVDPEAVGEALGEWWRGSRLRGASTISQQLARTLFLSQDRSVWRKVEEARLAWWLERRLGKKRILELYLNVVEFGPGLLGAEAAACHYHGLSAGELTAEYAAGLAACLPSPSRDNPDTASDLWSVRREIILRRIDGAGWLREKLEQVNGTDRRATLPQEEG
jgi:monofunctional biosynthetic peptidoglycan transglycosylase